MPDADKPSNDKEADPVRRFPRRFVIKREIDILAAAAFILSATAVTWQIFNYLKGPEITLFPTDTITIISSKKANNALADEPTWANFVGTMSYVNEASPDYPATVLRETLWINVGGCIFHQVWNQFVRVALQGENGETPIPVDDARPFPVTGSSSPSHETLFGPQRTASCPTGQDPKRGGEDPNRWDVFNRRLGQEKKLTVTSCVELTTKHSLSSTCVANFSDQALQELLKPNVQATKIPCETPTTSDQNTICQ